MSSPQWLRSTEKASRVPWPHHADPHLVQGHLGGVFSWTRDILSRLDLQGLGCPLSHPQLAPVYSWRWTRETPPWEHSPLCSYRPHSSPRRGTGLRRSFPGQSSRWWGQGRGRTRREDASTHWGKVHKQPRRALGSSSSSPKGSPLTPLTATILFMASSLRESLLVSSIAFRSSCLVGTQKVS